MRKKLLLAGWIAGILFPMAWFSRQIPGYSQWFDRIFAPPWMHILMHAVLYGILAAAVLLIWPESKSWHVLAAAAVVGILQEIVQPLPAGYLPNAGALFDLGVDLAGALAGLLVVTVTARRAFLSSRKSSIERNV